MSALAFATAYVSTPLALFFWFAALTPSDPPYPRYGEREAQCALKAIVLTFFAIWSIAVLCGASI